ncbi:hypothetical protein DEO72_LG10g2465 [Vigna unguiculata]|uniref:Uncharacterized protein n=1 Tax=Vigna unguiculata TaxID=3917 RepID=A0A4D6NEC2_VIGUN|nr:hypothetical protein DEO72_LG10g2465 [Vigna unguiculata]
MKILRQAAFFYKDVDVGDVRFDVNKDVVDGMLVDEVETSSQGDEGKLAKAEKAYANPDDGVDAKDAE